MIFLIKLILIFAKMIIVLDLFFYVLGFLDKNDLMNCLYIKNKQINELIKKKDFLWKRFLDEKIDEEKNYFENFKLDYLLESVKKDSTIRHIAKYEINFDKKYTYLHETFIQFYNEKKVFIKNPNNFTFFQNIKEIVFSGFNFYKISKKFNNLKKLKNLSIQNCELRYFSKKIKLNELDRLNLNNNYLTEMIELFNFPNLTILNIGRNCLPVPKDYEKCRKALKKGTHITHFYFKPQFILIEEK